MILTEEMFRRGLEIAIEGGTEDHPYDQSEIGGPSCGTPCCIVGHAMLAEGVDDVRDWEWPDIHDDASKWFQVAMGLATGPSPTLLRVIEQLSPDGDLKGANLRGVVFQGATLRGVDCAGADFSGATLSGIDMCWCNLSGCDFTDADLGYANMAGSNITNAVFTDAYVRGANTISCTGLTEENNAFD